MATLKISDLSVGDWVGLEMATLSIEGNDMATAFVKKAQLPARIKSILGDQDLILVEVYAEDNFGVRYLKMEYIHPIPITAEILEQNGWEFSRDNLWWTTQIAPYTRANVWLGNNGECRVEVSCMTKELDYYFCYADVKLPNAHIHLLQRVLRLAGVEKEINLQEL